MHEPPDHAKELNNRSSKKNPDYGHTLKSLHINDDDFYASNGDKNHREVEEGKEALAFFGDWVFGMSAHDKKKLSK